MGANFLRNRWKNGCSGSALVGLIVVVVLVILVASVRWYRKGAAKDPDLYNDLTPWKEWRLREASAKPPAEPSAQQPAIAQTLAFDTNAYMGGEPRGAIGLVILPDGSVDGAWSGQYYKKPKTNFDIMSGGFQGRVYPRKIYRDDNGEDPSRLYLMAKGEFLVAESDFDKNTLHHRGGAIYVRGWLNRDYSVSGTITITSDEKYSEEFEWKAAGPVKN